MPNETPEDSETEFFVKQLEYSLPWLIGIGYRFDRVEHNDSKLLCPWFTVHYANKAARREIGFSFGRTLDEPKRESMVIGIRGPEKEYFTLTDYLVHTGAPETVKANLRLISHEGPIQKQIAAVISIAQQLLEGELFNVAIGKHWIDVPFDWGGYK